MTVYGCATPDCKRMISSSIVPGGSPIAHANPEQWSLFGFSCGACNAMRCDRCAIRSIGACGCGQSLRIAIRPRPPEDGDASSTAVPASGTDDERAHAFAAMVAAQTGGELVEYSTVDFGRERRDGARTLLLDRAGRREGEQGIALVRLLRSMGLPPGVQVFANTLRNLGDDATHAGRDHVVFVASRDPFEVIRVADVDPVNHGLAAEDVVAQLMRWHERHGVEIVAADTETVVFRFLRMPEDVTELTQEIVEFCPDLEETFEMEPDTLAKSPWVWLWWD
ncbi:DUF4253 domain-containing protein [Lysobacter brunescens]|uniref:DUF4253 domain-containing protein n=1 Tax=Lysobacter brunescens TaxID=262323 RepID=A0ABW2Y9I6_9GAMM